MKRIHRKRALTSLVSGALVFGTLGVLAPTAQAAPSCEVNYLVRSDWGSGFTTDVEIINTGDPFDSWELEFDFPGNQQVTHGWSATWDQEGQHVTATSMSWNGSLDTGESTIVGFNGAYSGTNDPPETFTVNDTVCGDEPGNLPPTVAITSPEAGAEFTAPADITVSASASDPDGTVDQVEFSAGSTLIGTDSTAPYSVTWSGVSAGNYQLTAEAFDDSGDSTVSDMVPITVVEDTGPRVIVDPTAVDVPEGGEAEAGVSLSEAPSGNVAVTVARDSGDADLTVTAGSSLTFTPDNWSTSQPVVIGAAEDDDSENGTATFALTASGYEPASLKATELDNDVSDYAQRFMTLYNQIKDPANGYFSQHDLPIPYHSVETLIVEAPDYGHVTTSEAFSYWLWLEATYGRVTGDWTRFGEAWESMETHIIPAERDQPSNEGYSASSPATYAPEFDLPSEYPTPLDTGVGVGQDPLASELQSTYNTPNIYGMHWLLDVDNRYGYGFCGDGTTSPSYINTFQRGPQESVWETVPHPSCETFDYGGPNGYLDLFIDDQSYATQWRYTNAPDADARAVQAAYWALTWAREQGNEGQIADEVEKAAMMGDYLRYSFFDKYFKQIGNCVGASQCPAGSGKNSAHYLLSWYYAWGGGISASWAWRIGSSHAHFGYQNPMAAWVMLNVPELAPSSPSADDDWNTSLQRQLEFYRWLQSAEGGIAGGATNSWAGRYADPPADAEGSTFYGMFYDWRPVYHDPPSNQWFGFQGWSMERLAELYYVMEDGPQKDLAQEVLDKWVDWAISETIIEADGDFQVPATMEWSGTPDTWDPDNPGSNASLHVDVVEHGQDLGVAAALAKTLMFYAAESGDTEAQSTAKALIDGMWNHHRDDKGMSAPETRADFERFDDEVFIPQGWTGTMPNGDPIENGSTFTSIRSWYMDDPAWPKVQNYLDNPTPENAPEFEYHRFWAQADIAMAMATYDQLF